MKKLQRLNIWPIHYDKMNFFMAQNKGYIGRLYRLAIRRQFLKIKNPSFENRLITAFKWEDILNENKIRSELEK